MATTRLEYRKGTSSKFWEISSGSASYTVRFGRVGAGGQRQTKRIAGAQAEARRLIAAKLKKGYRLVSGKEVSAAQVRAIVGELDRVIRAYLRSNDKDPDDRGRYNLYPGASAVDIARYERQLGRDLPPSYRHFLRAHNGWLGFWGDNALLGAPRPYNAKRYAYVRRDLRHPTGTSMMMTRAQITIAPLTSFRSLAISTAGSSGSTCNASTRAASRRSSTASARTAAWTTVTGTSSRS